MRLETGGRPLTCVRLGFCLCEPFEDAGQRLANLVDFASRDDQRWRQRDDISCRANEQALLEGGEESREAPPGHLSRYGLKLDGAIKPRLRTSMT